MLLIIRCRYLVAPSRESLSTVHAVTRTAGAWKHACVPVCAFVWDISEAYIRTSNFMQVSHSGVLWLLDNCRRLQITDKAIIEKRHHKPVGELARALPSFKWPPSNCNSAAYSQFSLVGRVTPNASSPRILRRMSWFLTHRSTIVYSEKVHTDSRSRLYFANGELFHEKVPNLGRSVVTRYASSLAFVKRMRSCFKTMSIFNVCLKGPHG